jgi:hypothetical protein
MSSGSGTLPFAASTRVCTDDPLFLARDDEYGGVPIDHSLGPCPQSRARGSVFPVRPAAAAATTAIAVPADSSCSARGVSPVSSRTAPVVIDFDNEELVHPFVYRVRATVLVYAMGHISASATGASASMAPAVPRHSER